MTAELPGGLRQLYELPLAEVHAVAVLCRRGAKALRQDGLVLHPAVLERIADLENVDEAYRRHPISEGNAAASKASVSGRAPKSPVGKMGDVTINEAAALGGVTARRVRQLAGHRLPGRRTSVGWLLEADGVERWLADRDGRASNGPHA